MTKLIPLFFILLSYSLLSIGCCDYRLVRIDPCFNLRDAYGDMALRYSEEILQNSILEMRIDSLESAIQDIQKHEIRIVPFQGTPHWMYHYIPPDTAKIQFIY